MGDDRIQFFWGCLRSARREQQFKSLTNPIRRPFFFGSTPQRFEMNHLKTILVGIKSMYDLSLNTTQDEPDIFFSLYLGMVNVSPAPHTEIAHIYTWKKGQSGEVYTNLVERPLGCYVV